MRLSLGKMQNENERGANSYQLAGRGACFLAPDASVDRVGSKNSAELTDLPPGMDPLFKW